MEEGLHGRKYGLIGRDDDIKSSKKGPRCREEGCKGTDEDFRDRKEDV